MPIHRFVVDDHAAALAVLAGFAERFKETFADPFTGHLDQTERGDLRDLMLGAVTAQALGEPAQALGFDSPLVPRTRRTWYREPSPTRCTTTASPCTGRVGKGTSSKNRGHVCINPCIGFTCCCVAVNGFAGTR